MYLTYDEHFTAHKLLVECYPKNKKLAYALWRMANGKHDCSEIDYAFARESFRRAGFSEETRQKMSIARQGKSTLPPGFKHTEETKKKMSESAKNRRINGALGKRWTQSEETKDKHRQQYSEHNYHLVCRSCKSEFIADKPCYKYCENCRQQTKRR